MKKVILFILTFILFIPITFAEEKNINMYLFYGDGCPHCAALEEYLDTYLKDKKNIKLYKYEVWNSKENSELLEKVSKALDIEATGIPYLVIGEDVVSGFAKDITERSIDKKINKCLTEDYQDIAGIILGVVEGSITPKEDKPIDKEENQKKEEEKTFSIPLLGEVDAKKVSLPLIAVVMGLVDGFNPCAMWILLFLISMLIGMKDKKKLIILGLAFILSSGIIYLLFMVSWLNIAMFLNKIKIIKIIISLFALIFGLINIYNFIKSLKKDTGCEVVDTKKRKKIVTKIKNIVNNNSFILALFGVIVLAAGVNIIELLCSLGLPVIFTEILSLNNLSLFENGLYLFLYILFFLIDDIVIFLLAVFTLKITAISNKYTKYSHLIGGLIMLLIGLLMLLKPEWLMFNF